MRNVMKRKRKIDKEWVIKKRWTKRKNGIKRKRKIDMGARGGKRKR